VCRLVELLKSIGYENKAQLSASNLIGAGSVLTINAIIDVLLELGLVTFLIVIGKSLHVLSDMTTEDVPDSGVSNTKGRLNIS
jgi:hypothetical protein